MLLLLGSAAAMTVYLLYGCGRAAVRSVEGSAQSTSSAERYVVFA